MIKQRRFDFKSKQSKKKTTILGTTASQVTDEFSIHVAQSPVLDSEVRPNVARVGEGVGERL